MKNLYEKSAHLYDEVTNFKLSKEDIKFYFKKISKDDKVLEIGCGTGRVSIELAKRGNEVTAIDLSEKMLKLFEEKVKSISFIEEFKIHKMDMTNFQIDEKFDWIIFPFRVFQALINNKKRVDCLNCVKNHLKINGKIVIQMFNPNPIFFEKWDTMNFLDYEFYSETFQTKIKRFIVGEQHDKQEQTIKFHYKFVSENDIFIDKMELGYLYRNQAKKLFLESGFNIESEFSDWQENPIIENEKKELIFILNKLK